MKYENMIEFEILLLIYVVFQNDPNIIHIMISHIPEMTPQIYFWIMDRFLTFSIFSKA